MIRSQQVVDFETDSYPSMKPDTRVAKNLKKVNNECACYAIRFFGLFYIQNDKSQLSWTITLLKARKNGKGPFIGEK